MIWYEKEFEKEGTTVIIRGIFTNPQERPRSIIQISMFIGSSQRELYSHNPSMRISEDPQPDDIFVKYAKKIEKFERYIEANDLNELQNPTKFK